MRGRALASFHKRILNLAPPLASLPRPSSTFALGLCGGGLLSLGRGERLLLPLGRRRLPRRRRAALLVAGDVDGLVVLLVAAGLVLGFLLFGGALLVARLGRLLASLLCRGGGLVGVLVPEVITISVYQFIILRLLGLDG